MRDINHLQSAKINWHTQQCIVTKTAKRNLAIKPCITYQHQIRYQITQISITRNSCNSQLQSQIKSSDPFPIVCTSQLQNNPMCTPGIIYQQQNQYQTWPELCNQERHTACYSPHASTHWCLLFHCTSQLLSRPHVLSNPSTWSNVSQNILKPLRYLYNAWHVSEAISVRPSIQMNKACIGNAAKNIPPNEHSAICQLVSKMTVEKKAWWRVCNQRT